MQVGTSGFMRAVDVPAERKLTSVSSGGLVLAARKCNSPIFSRSRRVASLIATGAPLAAKFLICAKLHMTF